MCTAGAGSWRTRAAQQCTEERLDVNQHMVPHLNQGSWLIASSEALCGRRPVSVMAIPIARSCAIVSEEIFTITRGFNLCFVLYLKISEFFF